MKKAIIVLFGWYFLSFLPSGSSVEYGPYLTEPTCVEIRTDYLDIQGSKVLGATRCYLRGEEE